MNLLDKYNFPVLLDHAKYPETFLDAYQDALFIIGKLHIDDGLSGLDGDACISHLYRDHIRHELSLFLFHQTIPKGIPGQRRDYGGIGCVRAKVYMHGFQAEMNIGCILGKSRKKTRQILGDFT